MNQFLLTKAQKNQVIHQTRHYIELANQQHNLNLTEIKVKFDLKGRTSGMFMVRNGLTSIRYNEIIFSHYFEDSLINTVAHEVAHYVVHTIWGVKKVKPHGKEWQQVMLMFDVKPDVTSQYDVSGLPLHRQTQHDYSCGCMMHQLSTTRHNKVQKKKAIYKCRKCRLPLRLSSRNI
ncbi:MAG: metallopeptidase (SprT family) [endosymbiont of Galathealinum brachiosum]|uniref:Metallopeptidase (SprT family) n=1 Tax=endosymbiont of Galathealinum brachiosum TaxID=2200906 RepID=A0A370DG49_9GAMM|nr:MAG: metallopeptidase (SprT family) [endosymbiont of Galathealinum brachiosum]